MRALCSVVRQSSSGRPFAFPISWAHADQYRAKPAKKEVEQTVRDFVRFLEDRQAGEFQRAAI